MNNRVIGHKDNTALEKRSIKILKF